MKVTVSTCRKIGQPNYGSVGASCEVSIEIEPGRPAIEQIRAAYQLADQAVAEQLAGQVDDPTDRPPPPPPSEPSRPRPGRPSNGSQAAYEANGRVQRKRAGLFDVDRRPRSGLELLGWLRKRAGEHPGLSAHLREFAEAEGMPTFFKLLTGEQTESLVIEAGRWVEEAAAAN